MAKSPKTDAQLEADIEYLSTMLAKGISGIIDVGIADGMKIGQALKRVTMSKANDALISQLWSRFFLVNSRAAAAIEVAAALNPKLAELLERLRMKAKEVKPGDAEIKDAEVC